MRTITDSTPRKDGFRMPGEFEEHKQAWMLWPERPDNWRNGAKPAQQVFANVANAIAQFEPITVGVSDAQFENARRLLGENVRVVEISSNDSWVRDCGPTFVKNDKGEVRAVNWDFNAWGGLFDGLYFPWDKDDRVPAKICNIENVDMYKPDHFVLEGGSIHVDGEGTLVVTEQCLLSPGRNPELTKEQIEEYGIEPFIQECKKSVWKYKGEWERMSERIGYWADMENPYVTYDNNYIESVWWSLKRIHEMGLLYKLSLIHI